MTSPLSFSARPPLQALLGGEPLLQGLEDDDTRLPSSRRYRRRKETLAGDPIDVPAAIYNQIMALVDGTPSSKL